MPVEPRGPGKVYRSGYTSFRGGIDPRIAAYQRGTGAKPIFRHSRMSTTSGAWPVPWRSR